jgi:hypothetical protein
MPNVQQNQSEADVVPECEGDVNHEYALQGQTVNQCLYLQVLKMIEAITGQ